MTTEELLAKKKELTEASDKSSTALREFCKPHQNAIGITSDDIKVTDEYKRLKAQFNRDFQAFRDFNGKYAKQLNKLSAHARRWHTSYIFNRLVK